MHTACRTFEDTSALPPRATTPGVLTASRPTKKKKVLPAACSCTHARFPTHPHPPPPTTPHMRPRAVCGFLPLRLDTRCRLAARVPLLPFYYPPPAFAAFRTAAPQEHSRLLIFLSHLPVHGVLDPPVYVPLAKPAKFLLLPFHTLHCTPLHFMLDNCLGKKVYRDGRTGAAALPLDASLFSFSVLTVGLWLQCASFWSPPPSPFGVRAACA